MLRIIKLFAGFLTLVPALTYAQEGEHAESLRKHERNKQLVQSIDSGYYATELEHLVDSSDVIIRGRYGAVESRYIDYGDGRKGNLPRNTALNTESPATAVAAFGIPMVDYEIVIDEIIKGNDILLDASVLTIRMGESPDAYEVFAWLAELREGEHLFFLQHHRGSTYLIRGGMFDLKKIDNAFYYRDHDGNKYVTVFGSENAHLFLKSITDFISLAGNKD